ncbi:MAG: thiamine-phosphate kinase [Elusimicrobia bacterium]|nr:thiamine-phosphate kinase [Elusimicrobiota bacterium]
MKLSDFGEYKLIQQRILPVLGRQAVLGDDCGWIPIGDGKVLLVSTDAVVENTHYLLAWMSPEDLARKTLRTALSDIAAMGGAESLSCVVAMGRRAQSSTEAFDRFIRCLHLEARRWKVKILGGDLTQVGAIGAIADEFVVVTVFGVAFERGLLRRDRARPGELLWLSGPVGLAQAGLEVLGMDQTPSAFKSLKRYQQCPVLRLLEGTRLSAHDISRCAIDLSDSLAASLLWISSQSKVALEVNLRQFPVPKILERWSRYQEKGIGDYLLYGGEDYELLFTSASSARFIDRHLQQSYPIGRVLKGAPRVLVMGIEGGQIELRPGHAGYEAFHE